MRLRNRLWILAALFGLCFSQPSAWAKSSPTLRALRGVKPTKKRKQSFRLGPWRISHAKAKGTARNTRTREKITLWSTPKSRRCTDYGSMGRLVSVVGTMVSFEISEGGYCKGAAHPYAWHGFRTIDLAKPKDARDVDLPARAAKSAPYFTRR